MAKKSKKQRAAAKQKRERGPVSGTRPRVAPVALLVVSASEPPIVASASASTFIDDDVVVEIATPSERDVEEALAAVREEKRESERVSLSVDIHLSSDSQFFSGLSGDISEGGLFLSTYRAIAIGSPVALEFSLPGAQDAVRAKGEVRWLREHSTGQPRGVGIAFEELADEDRERIERFCTVRPPLYYEDVG